MLLPSLQSARGRLNRVLFSERWIKAYRMIAAA